MEVIAAFHVVVVVVELVIFTRCYFVDIAVVVFCSYLIFFHNNRNDG